MATIEEGADISRLDLGVKNKWRWDWLDGIGEGGVKIRSWCRKVSAPGVCCCTICNKSIKYGSSGKKSLTSHQNDSRHAQRLKELKTLAPLPGCSLEHGTPSKGDAVSSKATKLERIHDAKIKTVAFIAEHNLPFTMAPHLIGFAKNLSQDKSVINKLSISNNQASYLTSHGIAACLKNEMKNQVGNGNVFLSINVDEATNTNNEKVRNIIIRYYDEETKRVVTKHYSSSACKSGGAAIFLADMIKSLDECNINVKQIISALFDNCNFMRGKHGGVETLLRKENPYLLDCHGDTVHIVNNAAKQFIKPLDEEYHIQDLLLDIYYDIEKSPKQSEIFEELQDLIYGKHQPLKRVISSRFLQLREVAERVITLWDALIAYYSGFLEPEERDSTRKRLLDPIYQQHKVSPQAKDRIEMIQLQLRKDKKTCSKEGKSRKDSIINALIDKSTQTKCLLNTCRGLLEKLLGYVKKFQTDLPIAHLLHSEMFLLLKSFLALFMVPGHIPNTPKEIQNANVFDKNHQLLNKHLSVGAYSYNDVKEARKKHSIWVSVFYTKLRWGFAKAAQYMQTNLPLTNPNITNLSALNPVLFKEALPAFMSLAEKLPNVVLPEELGTLDEEIRIYTVSDDVQAVLKDFVSQDPKTRRTDIDFWSKIFQLREASSGGIKFPFLSKLVKSLLSIFSGPIVESTFNVMDDIIRADRPMKIKTYESLALIKSKLKVDNTRGYNINITPSMRKYSVAAYANYQTFLEEQKQQKETEKQKKLEKAAKNLAEAKQKELETYRKAEKAKQAKAQQAQLKIEVFDELTSVRAAKQAALQLPGGEATKQIPVHLPNLQFCSTSILQ